MADKKVAEPKVKQNNAALHTALKATGYTIDAASATISTVLRVVGSILLILFIAGLLFTCIFAYYVKTCLTPELDLSLEDYQLSEASTIWYQDISGEWQSGITIGGNQKRIWVEYEDIPKYMEQALIAIEDKRFYEHKGVDWYRTAGAFIQMFARMETSYGGSTITQQLLKNLTGKDQVTVQRKLTEIFGALELEKKYDKQEILEYYLNAVYFGEGCWGVGIAAQTYFGKDVKDLSLAECAAIVGITNKPTYYDPFYNEENNKKRQETILREMYEQGYIDYSTWKEAVAEELVFTRTPNQEYHQEIYSYYEEVVIYDVIRDLMNTKGLNFEAAERLLYNGGYQIYSCMDARIQDIVDALYSDPDLMPKGGRYEQQFQSGIVIMNPYDGRILALCGGVGEKTINFGLNRAVPVSSGGVNYGGATRSPGSAIKPLASYGPALNEGLITPDTLVNDSANIVLAGTSWYPHNDNYENYGVLSIYQALKWSLNTVAAQIVDKLPNGPSTSYDYLTQRLGFTSLVPDDASYAPMALGQLTNGVSVREMAQAYCALVNDGIFTYSRTYSMVTDSRGNIVLDNVPQTIAAFDPNTAYSLTYMLKNAVDEGTGTDAKLTNMPVAGKTGTSGEYKDRWFAGVTPYYVGVVWMGFDIPERINSSGNPAARVWRQVMNKVHSGLTWTDFTYPYLGPDTHLFIDAPAESARSDQDLIEEGIITDDFDSEYYWGNVYNGDSVYEQPSGGNDTVVIIGG
ncbi:MAG: transglycosylase domain-containing protein [Oscillospiraceae bacterium]|nr:transglycosylase domain-containing protein [Oscillospiraceae bacterium]MBR0390731.1 transglycosylase domain-containing protein [Oscillospiraceae bacterium]